MARSKRITVAKSKTHLDCYEVRVGGKPRPGSQCMNRSQVVEQANAMRRLRKKGSATAKKW
jgi:hypothetical protein